MRLFPLGVGRGRRADLRRIVEDYVLFDCPGQVELFTHHESLRNIFFRIQKFGYRVRSSLGILDHVLQKCVADWMCWHS